MQLLENEKELVRGAADTLLFNTFRLSTVTLILTSQRVIVIRMITTDEYELDEIVSAERFKAMFMNIGIRFRLQNGQTVSLATRHIKKFVEQLQQLGKMQP